MVFGEILISRYFKYGFKKPILNIFVFDTITDILLILDDVYLVSEYTVGPGLFEFIYGVIIKLY